VFDQLFRIGCRTQEAALRQGDDHHQHRSCQKKDKGAQNDHGDPSMTPRLLELLSVLYYLLRLLNIYLYWTDGILSRSCGACPSWPGFLANAGSSIIPWSLMSSSRIKAFFVWKLNDRNGNSFCKCFDAKHDMFLTFLMHSSYDITRSWESRLFYPIIFWCREKTWNVRCKLYKGNIDSWLITSL